MKTIYKYSIKVTDKQEIQIPCNAKIIHVGLDPQGVPCLWAEVDTTAPMKPVSVFIVGTGNPMPHVAHTHFGSFIQGPFMWHVYLG